MANEVKNVDAGSSTTVISIAANMANSYVAGITTELDNSTARYTRAMATVYVSAFNTTPTANKGFELWMRRSNSPSTDTGGSSVTSTPSNPAAGFASTEGMEFAGYFPVAATTSAQRISREIAFSNVNKAYFVLRNMTDVQANAGAGTELTVTVRPFTEAPT